MSQYETGISGEAKAEQYLTGLGLQCVARRYRAEDGELDLVMLAKDMVVFVEVKSRPRAHPGAGMLTITPDKQRRIAHAAMAFLIRMEWMDRPVRFDVVEINAQGILHVPNAFMPPVWS